MIRSRTRALLAAALTLGAMAAAAASAAPAQADWTPDWSALPPCHSETYPVDCVLPGRCTTARPTECIPRCDLLEWRDCTSLSQFDYICVNEDENGEGGTCVEGAGSLVEYAADTAVGAALGGAGLVLSVAGGAVQIVEDTAEPVLTMLDEPVCVVYEPSRPPVCVTP